MAIDFRPLNRHQEFSTPQKAALKKVFTLLEQAAVNSNINLCTPTMVHLAMGGKFSAADEADIKALCKFIREATVALDPTRDVSHVLGAFRMEGTKKKVIKTIGQYIATQVST